MCAGTAGDDCHAACAQLQTPTFARCRAAVSALLSCARGSPIDGAGANPFSACARESSAVSACITAAPDAGPSACAATSCGACANGSTCGWCDGRCHAGTIEGPDTAACSEPWAWTRDACPR